MRKARASLALGPSGAHGSPVGAAASEMSRHTASVASRHTAPPSPRFDLAPSGPETEKYQLLCHSCVPTAPDRMRVIEVARAQRTSMVSTVRTSSHGNFRPMGKDDSWWCAWGIPGDSCKPLWSLTSRSVPVTFRRLSRAASRGGRSRKVDLCPRRHGRPG